MDLRHLIFPRESRFFPGQRWVNIGLRIVHLIGVAGLGAGFLYPAADSTWLLYYSVTLYSGLGLSILYTWCNGIWLVQLRGQAILLKVLLLFLIPYLPGLEVPLFLIVVVISGLISHATANVRYYSLIHRRRIESLYQGEDLRD